MSWPLGPEAALVVDLYELTMAQAYLALGMEQEATFDLFVRHLPAGRDFLLAAGLEQALDYLEDLRFDEAAIAGLRRLGGFDERLLGWLAKLRFTGEVWALPEGELAFAGEPLLRVTAPLPQAQLVESYLLNAVTFQTLIASKAARLTLACRGRPFVEFGLRRAHGPLAALLAARAAYLGGAAATSDVLAAIRFGIPPSGTMAHSFVTAFEDELEAFRAFAGEHGDRTVLLIDTYDTLQGARHAARVGQELRARGQHLAGVRLDSGALRELAPGVRAILDAAGLTGVRIFASGDLDEHLIDALTSAGVPIDAFGVGTQLDTSADAPALGGVYKLAEYAGAPRMKLSAQKVTLPGRKQVFRLHAGHHPLRDVLGLEGERVPHGAPLLVPVMRRGRRLAPQEPLADLRGRALLRLEALAGPLRRLDAGARYPVTLSGELSALTHATAAALRERLAASAAPQMHA